MKCAETGYRDGKGGKRRGLEGVRFKTRRLNLGHLPIIGGVLKALNMQEALTIKDPILVPRKRYYYLPLPKRPPSTVEEHRGLYS